MRSRVGGREGVRRSWSSLWRARRADVGALAAIVMFFVAFFPQAVFGGKFLIAGDAYFYSYPLRTVAWDMIRSGQPPLWTPHVLSGYPLLAMAQLAIGYPLTWGYLILPGHWAEQLYVLAPFLLSPMFTYAYARELGRSPLASLLAGLGFGYGGMMCSGISNSGMLTNSMLWLPLMLIPIDRARQTAEEGGRGRFAPCLVAATAAYSMSVLNGHGQSFVYTGALAAAYGLFLSLFPVRALTNDEADDQTATRVVDEHATPRGWFEFGRWRPLFVAIGAIGLAASVAAFQILETMRAARRSTRRALSYETLGEGSFTFMRAARSLVAPLYHYIDVTTYVPPLVFLLALFACATALRRREGTDARIFFWLAVAVAAWVLMLGSNTPFHHVVFRIPVVNSFRVPSRHALEWTFALAVLAAYGWDALARLARRARRAKLQTMTTGRRGELLFGWLALAAAAVVGALWWRATVQPPVPGSNSYTALAEHSYLLWKACFVVLLCAALGLALKSRASHVGRKLLLVSVVLLTCYVEQFAIITCWWGGLGLDAERFAVVSPVTKHLQTLAPAANRVYTRTGLFAEEFTLRPRFEGANLTALHGLHNVAGMEPLIFERYSRALGGVGPDSVTPRAGFPPNDDLFQARSRVLDLLNTTHVVSYSNLASNMEENIFKDGISFAPRDAHIALAPGESATCAGSGAATAGGAGDTLALVTVLSNSIEVGQGETVAKVRLHVSGGATVERELRAGTDTAEWAHERADVRRSVQHSLAPVFDAHAGDTSNSFSSYRYLARVNVGSRARLEKIEITNTTRGATLNVVKATLYDSADKNSTPLTLASSEWWQTIYQKDGALVMRNLRARPRAWLVGEAEAVDGEEALRRIRGESVHAFDPRRTALLEVAAGELPVLAGGELPAESEARVVEYEPSRLVIETSAPTRAVLVVSEMIYPGWEATIDGRVARIEATNYLLRGVVVPAGAHRVEMRYRATAARVGAVISACALLLLCGLAVYDWRMRRRHE